MDPFHPRAGQIPHGVGAKIEMGRTNRRGCGENLNGFMCSVSICEASKGSEMQCNALLKKKIRIIATVYDEPTQRISV